MRIAVTTMIAGMLVLQGCRERPPFIGSAADPADPASPSSGSRYRSVTGDARTYRIVEPKPWDQLNRDVAPKKK